MAALKRHHCSGRQVRCNLRLLLAGHGPPASADQVCCQPYLQRHRVCTFHYHLESLELGGSTVRFCQQVGRSRWVAARALHQEDGLQLQACVSLPSRRCSMQAPH